VLFNIGMNPQAQHIIAQLGLVPLPLEGGYFRETWTSAAMLASGRAASSAIYFFMAPGEFSALHRMAAEEVWHFYSGDAVEHLQLDPSEGRVTLTKLGSDVTAGERPQLSIPSGIWQGARLAPGGRHSWALLGCTVSPAWDQAEFELGDRAALQLAFPGNDTLIRTLTR
jgi:predicted cupin superfamily sugar epimerase